MTSSQHRVFVSHSSKDNTFGLKLTEDLRRVLGEDEAVWYDVEGGLYGGDKWWRKIVEELNARNICLVILSTDAMASSWVNDEIDIAWRQKNSPAQMRIFPLLYRQCKVRSDLENLQMISFLPPRSYEVAFNDLLVAMGLPPQRIESAPRPAIDNDTLLLQQLTPPLVAAFEAEDWPDVMRKTQFLLKRISVIPASIYRMYGVALYKEGKLQEGLEALNHALILVSDRSERLLILRSLIDIHMAQEQWQEVIQYFKEALRLAPNDAAWKEKRDGLVKQWLEEAGKLLEKGQYTESMPLINRLLELDPNNAAAYFYRGRAYINLKEYQKAIADYDQALRLDPNAAYVYHNRGYAYNELKEYQKAIADYDQALRLDPNAAYAYNNRGRAYNELKEYQKAIADYDQALRIDPNYAYPYNNRGNAYSNLGEYEKALADYDQVLRLDPNYAKAYNGRGNAYYLLGEYRKAIADYDQALRIDPNYTLAKNNREEALRKLQGK